MFDIQRKKSIRLTKLEDNIPLKFQKNTEFIQIIKLLDSIKYEIISEPYKLPELHLLIQNES